jgi:hypothetical protein
VSHTALLGTIARVIADERLLSLIRLILASHAPTSGPGGDVDSARGAAAISG